MSDECECCGEPIDECTCPECEECGETNCRHMEQRAYEFLEAWGWAIQQEKARREAVKHRAEANR
jgi:hypothetical protein